MSKQTPDIGITSANMIAFLLNLFIVIISYRLWHAHLVLCTNLILVQMQKFFSDACSNTVQWVDC